MPSSSVCGLRGGERIPAHVRDLQRRIGRRDLVDLAADPAEALGHHVFAAALGHELHADADAEERPALAAHRLLQRLDHAGHRIEPAPAIGEGADARQHDAVGAAHRVGIARHHDRLIVAALARRALERLGGRVQIARAVIDDRDAHVRNIMANHGRDCGSGNRPMTSGRTVGTCAGRRRRRRLDRRMRRRAAGPAIEEAPLGGFAIVARPRCRGWSSGAASSAAACRLRSRPAARSATPTANFTSAGHAERPEPGLDRRGHQRDTSAAPATAGATASTAARAGTPRSRSRRARTRSGRAVRPSSFLRGGGS